MNNMFSKESVKNISSSICVSHDDTHGKRSKGDTKASTVSSTLCSL